LAHEGGGTVARGPQRWTEVTRSQFTHETEGLGLVRALLPQRDPFRAWSNFEFRDRQVSGMRLTCWFSASGGYTWSS